MGVDCLAWDFFVEEICVTLRSPAWSGVWLSFFSVCTTHIVATLPTMCASGWMTKKNLALSFFGA